MKIELYPPGLDHQLSLTKKMEMELKASVAFVMFVL